MWKLTPWISIFWKLRSRMIDFCNFYFGKFFITWEINFWNNWVYSRSILSILIDNIMNKTDLTITYEIMFLSSCINLALVLLLWIKGSFRGFKIFLLCNLSNRVKIRNLDKQVGTYHNWNRTCQDKKNTISNDPYPSQAKVPILKKVKNRKGICNAILQIHYGSLIAVKYRCLILKIWLYSLLWSTQNFTPLQDIVVK